MSDNESDSRHFIPEVNNGQDFSVMLVVAGCAADFIFPIQLLSG